MQLPDVELDIRFNSRGPRLSDLLFEFVICFVFKRIFEICFDSVNRLKPRQTTDKI